MKFVSEHESTKNGIQDALKEVKINKIKVCEWKIWKASLQHNLGSRKERKNKEGSSKLKFIFLRIFWNESMDWGCLF